MNINNAFLEKSTGYFEIFREKLSQFGIKIYTPENFTNIFDINKEIFKAGGSDFTGFDLVTLEIPNEHLKLEEGAILNSIEPWKISAIYSCVKNYRNSVIIVDTDDFDGIIESLDECGDVTLQDRRMLSLKALYRLLRFTSSVHKEMSELFASEKFETLILEEITTLKYGENPHQLAYLTKIAKHKAFFDFVNEDALIGLSYNNIVDMHVALTALRYLRNDFVVQVHHGTIVEAKTKNFNFKNVRGVVAANFVNEGLLKALEGNDLDVILLPDTSKVKARHSVNLKEIPVINTDREYRFLDGNFLIQTPDDLENMRFFSEEIDAQYIFANVIAALSRSMSCCIFKDYELIGLGSGQPEQIDSLEAAVRQAQRRLTDIKDAICAFDGPIRDLEVADDLIKFGIKTVIEPGGVKEDRIMRKKFDENGIELIFSGKRRYKH